MNREAISCIDVRSNNTRRIILALRNNPPMTKRDLSLGLDLSVSTVASIVKILLDSGYIFECGNTDFGVGRKATLLTLNSDRHISVGIFVNTYDIDVAVVNFGGEILVKESFSLMYQGTPDYWATVSTHLEHLLAAHRINKSLILGACIAVPPVLSLKHMVFRDINFPDNMISNNEIGDYFSYNVSVIPAAIAAGIPRLWYGKINKDGLVILLSRFIDACFVHMSASEHLISYRRLPLAHIGIGKKGERCFCGKRGCFQTYCSTSLIADKINGLDTSKDVMGKNPGRPIISTEKIFAEIANGNEEYAQIWDEYLEDLAYALHNVHISICDDIILCGETVQYLTEYKSVLVEKLQELSSFDDGIYSWLHINNRREYDVSVGAALYICNNILNNF